MVCWGGGGGGRVGCFCSASAHPFTPPLQPPPRGISHQSASTPLPTHPDPPPPTPHSSCLCVDCMYFLTNSRLLVGRESAFTPPLLLHPSISQPIFYFMSVHIEVILDKNKKQKHIIIIYTNFPSGL